MDELKLLTTNFSTLCRSEYYSGLYGGQDTSEILVSGTFKRHYYKSGTTCSFILNEIKRGQYVINSRDSNYDGKVIVIPQDCMVLVKKRTMYQGFNLKEAYEGQYRIDFKGNDLLFEI
jgi:hypothetical protein